MNTRPVVRATLALALLAATALGAATPTPTPRPAAKTITNVWIESDLRAVLADIAQQAGTNIVVGELVQGAVTFEARKFPVEKCLAAVLAPGGYVFRKIDDYYLVGSLDPDSPSFGRLADTRMLVLNHATAQDVRSLLPRCFSQYAAIGSSKSDITITAPPDLMAKVIQAIERIDIPPRQVIIEALVTELSDDCGKELGIDWSWNWDTSTVLPNPRAKTEEGVKGRNAKSGTVDMLRNNGHFPGSLGYASTTGFTRALQLNIQQLVQEGKAKVRANPRIMAINGTVAEIHVGRSQHYAFLVDSNELIRAGISHLSSYTIKEIVSGVTLKVMPRISDDGFITVDLAPEVSEVVGLSEQGLPILNKRNAKATVRVRSGETIVIGGLTQESENTITRKVPVLGDIPILGWLFKQRRKQKVTKEIVILITPRLPAKDGAAQAKKN
ncbi:hypothetical protein HQ576_12425 [bacterium]|nr:hypothetical protein [bacterium]